MRIVLAGHAGFFNKGCEAIVKTTVALLQAEFKNLSIILSSGDHVNDRLLAPVPGMRVVRSQFDSVWKRWSVPWAFRQAYRFYDAERSVRLLYLPVLPSLLRSDVVLSVGGDNFTADYGFPADHLRMNRIVKDMGKKLVIWGATIGPFPEDDLLRETVEGIACADLITARESLTVDYLRTLGITRNVRRTADTAFLLPPREAPIEGIVPDNRDAVGFNISPILGKYRNDGGSAANIDASVAFLQRLLDDSDYHVVLVPHVTRGGDMNNDAAFMEEVLRRLEHTGRVSMVPAGFDCQQVKYAIARCRFFIGARTHATIAALSSGVPTLSIGYSRKSRGINRDVLGDETYMLPVGEVTGASLFDRFSRLVAHEQKIRETLTRNIPLIQGLARDNVVHLRRLLSSA